MFYVKDYDPPLWRAAADRAAAMPVYAGSHRRQAANQVGALGEVVFESFLKAHGIVFDPRYKTTEDLEVLGDTIDVKTKDRTVRPLPHHDCSVPLYNHEHQRPSVYVFVSLFRSGVDQGNRIERFKKAFLVGWCTLERLESIGRVWEAGETDPANGTRFWTSCKNIAIQELSPMRELLDAYAGRAIKNGSK